MALSKSRLFVSALAAAGLGAVVLGYAAPHVGNIWLPRVDKGALAQTAPSQAGPSAAAEAGKSQVRADQTSAEVRERDVRVDAPHTTVRVNKDSGKVAVSAPHTDVKVDPDKGQVRVRAPYVNLDIRW